jgi:hypothetical protein
MLSTNKKKTFLIWGICFTYKFVIPNTKTKQNKFFVVFEILANVLLTFTKLIIKVKMHAKILFFGV